MFVGCVTAKLGGGSAHGRGPCFLKGGRSVEFVSKSCEGSTSKGQKHDDAVQPPEPSCNNGRDSSDQPSSATSVTGYKRLSYTTAIYSLRRQHLENTEPTNAAIK